MQKEVMTKAVAMAKKFEGDWVARMALALKTAWAIVRKRTKITLKSIEDWAQDLKDVFMMEQISIRANVWEKYGKRRIYLNVGYEGIGYVEIDDNNNYVKSWVDRSFLNFGDRWMEEGRAIDLFHSIKTSLDNGEW